MKPTLHLIRAIGTEFTRRAIRPLMLLGIVLAVVLLVGGGYLVTISAWWWILEVVTMCGVLTFGVLVLVLRAALRVADPPQTAQQRQAVRHYVDKLQRVSEHLQTPQLVILFRVIRDTVRPRGESFIESVSQDTKSLTPDFVDLQKEFQSKRDT